MKVALYDELSEGRMEPVDDSGRLHAIDHAVGFIVSTGDSKQSYQTDSDMQQTKSKGFPGFAPIGP